MNRRAFLTSATVGSTVAILGRHRAASAADPPPETTRIRLVNVGSPCQSPQYVAKDLLRSEGFTDVQYVRKQGVTGIEEALVTGEADINMHYALRCVVRLEAGDPIVILGGVHPGCVELFGSSRVRSIRDLKGKKVASGLASGSIQHQLLGVMLTQVGLDPHRDVEWVHHPSAEAIRLLADGGLDGFVGIPPEPQELRARKIGHVLLDTGRDRPWSQYFCCMAVGNRDFARKHPIATKRALRAILKAADMCSTDPDGVARRVVDGGFTASLGPTRQTLGELNYRAWRDFDPEEAVRFYALRLQEAGFIKSSPKKILAEGTDWRAFRELRKELKG